MLKGLWPKKKKSCLKVETIIVSMLAIQPPKNKKGLAITDKNS